MKKTLAAEIKKMRLSGSREPLPPAMVVFIKDVIGDPDLTGLDVGDSCDLVAPTGYPINITTFLVGDDRYQIRVTIFYANHAHVLFSAEGSPSRIADLHQYLRQRIGKRSFRGSERARKGSQT